MSALVAYPLKFQAGARTFLTVRRSLVRIAYGLPAALRGDPPVLDPQNGAQGYVLTSLPETLIEGLKSDGLLLHVRQRYTRHYADFADGFDAYLAHFSSKSRATLNRKRKRFAEAADGTIDVRGYRTPEEIEQFLDAALPLSQRSYQHRLLDAGLPEDEAARGEMMALAATDRLRAFLLFKEGKPVAYLYMPVVEGVLIYAYLGYDPVEAELSPGTVLQFEAIRVLAEDGQYTRLDFTEGEGQHKRLFGTAGVACADVLLLRPTLTNRLIMVSLAGFDGLIASLKRLSSARGFNWLKAMRR